VSLSNNKLFKKNQVYLDMSPVVHWKLISIFLSQPVTQCFSLYVNPILSFVLSWVTNDQLN